MVESNTKMSANIIYYKCKDGCYSKNQADGESSKSEGVALTSEQKKVAD